MEAPVFEEFDPASDCDCAGCVHWRRVMPHSSNAGLVSHPAACKALVLAAAAGTVLGIGQPTPAVAAAHGPAQPGIPAGDEPDTPQGGKAPLHGPQGRPPAKPGKPSTLTRTPATTRAEIINRAKGWVAAQVPYSMDAYWSDGYRQDCSGFVSMAWSLPGNEWTGTLGAYGVRISRDQLQPGDILLFHNPADPEKGSHVVIFGGWTDYTHTYYLAYEQTLPHTRKQATPYGYWSNSDRYLPYRYKGLDDGASGAVASSQDTKVTRYPGYAYFGYGASNAYVTQLGRLLVQRGGGRFYTSGPGPRWSDADQRATEAFQRAQGWTGADADGLPGPETWSYLVGNKGNDIPAPYEAGYPGPQPSAPSSHPASYPSSHGVPGYPGRAMFRPGAHNPYVTRLGKQLVKKGFGKYYTAEPGPRWGEADRRNVEAFQRSQGWRGGAADGFPGPETWRRLFS
ncbi:MULTISPECIES: peptidoglycan-binding protein [unclassified Streptomyces]|uniref:peptidoglycan-binding protein n=1 Tax=unclassified Streptomyces TaxID=2593676 RepID=UPI002E800739|nr:peptidoglycan-binding protein [Streptomyces sp. NBC_00589]WTI38954.1 peptidoglycan-binding protein [Streptomyces sp. NBC_00775]WUB27366.1 peptidoglycan-binding protein [Streptomyces sp. NBC_00589]